MSLVNEALKKAHAEASRRHADASTLLGPRPAPRLYSPELQKPKTGFVIALISTVFVVALSATVLRVTAGTSSTPSASKVKAKPAPAFAASIQPRLSLPAPPKPATGDSEPKIEKTPESSGQAPADLGNVPVSTPIYEPVAPSPAPVTSGVGEGKVYIQSVNLRNDTKIVLNGILWSDKPLAILNNITVGPGEEIGDVTVIAIEPKRVKVSANGKEFFIRLP